jgi:hypothetical protein
VSFENFLHNTGFAHLEIGNAVMILIGIIFIYLAVAKDYEPLLLIPIGLGIIVGNVPPIKGMILGVYDQGSVLYYLYFGVTKGIYPPLIFLGIGAMTDFSTMLSNPKLIDWHIPDFFGLPISWLFPGPGRFHWDHWRGRRTDSHIPLFHAGPGAARAHCHSSIFIHGSCSGNPATDHVSVYH